MCQYSLPPKRLHSDYASFPLHSAVIVGPRVNEAVQSVYANTVIAAVFVWSNIVVRLDDRVAMHVHWHEAISIMRWWASIQSIANTQIRHTWPHLGRIVCSLMCTQACHWDGSPDGGSRTKNAPQMRFCVILHAEERVGSVHQGQPA